MLLSFIVHQTNEFYGPASPETSWVKTIVGPTIAGVITLLVFFLGLYFAKRRERINTRKENNNLLNYHSLLAKNIVSTFNDQAGHINTFALEKRAHPFNFGNKLQLKVNRDVDRIQELDQSKLLKAFDKRNKLDEQTLEKFRKIYSCTDFLFAIRNQINENTKVDHQMQIELTNEFAVLAKDVEVKVASVVNKGRNNNLPNTDAYNGMWNGLNTLLAEFYTAMSNGTISIDGNMTAFINPVRTLLLNSFSELPEAEEILIGCKKTGDKHKAIEQYQFGASDEMQRIKTSITNTTEMLAPLIPEFIPSK